MVASIQSIFDGLKSNRSVTRLDMASNMMTGNFEFENFQYEAQAIFAMKDALEKNCVIEHLDISNNG